MNAGVKGDFPQVVAPTMGYRANKFRWPETLGRGPPALKPLSWQTAALLPAIAYFVCRT